MATHADLLALDREFSKWLGTELEKLIPLVKRGLAAGMTPSAAVAYAAGEVGIEGALLARVVDDMVKATAIGMATGAAPVVMTQGAALAFRATYLQDFWPGDEFNVSQRIAGGGLQRAMASEISRQLAASARFENAVATWQETAQALTQVEGPNRERLQGQLSQSTRELTDTARLAAKGDPKAIARLRAEVGAAQRAVNRLGLYGAPNQALRVGYQRVIDAAQALNIKALDSAVENAARQKARYYAERIARTEKARAYGTAVFSRAANDPDVIGVTWRLSSRHPQPDICDLHSHADHYGMGPGAYPSGSVPPYPAHPHCLCQIGLLYVGAVPVGRFRPGRAAKWLAEQPRDFRVALLGARSADRPEAWRDNLKMWQGHRNPQVYPNAASLVREQMQAAQVIQ